MVDDNIIEEIKSRLDIIDIISDYTDLKKAGNNFKALCPFHSEKTPSFTVSPQKQIFHCFGCGAGGDIFGFIMRYENVTFPEALEILAERAGVEIKKSYSRKSTKENDILFNINEDAALFYSNELRKSKKAIEYFRQRGLDDETVRSFRLGYAPSGFESLLNHLKEKGYSESSINKAGLIKYSEKGKPYDMFRDRIIFPIAESKSGRIIAFGGRIFSPEKGSKAPKYINSPETPIFYKSKILFGLDIANKAIREKKYVIVTEGYMDVIVCHQFGFKHTVAPLGTALTESHVKELGKFWKNLLLIFDADEAGLNAARRSLKIIYSKGLQAKVLNLPKGEDPDSFLIRNGAQAFQEILGKESKELLPFYLELDISEEERDQDLRDIALSVPDSIKRGQLKKEILFKTANTEIFQQSGYRKFTQKVRNSDEKPGRIKNTTPEDHLLMISFSAPKYAKEIISKINTEDIEKMPLKNILLKVKEMRDLPSLENLSSVFSESEASYITSLTINSGFDEERIEDIISDCFFKIRKRTISRKIDEIDKNIKKADSTGDTSKVDSLLSEKLRLIQEAQE